MDPDNTPAGPPPLGVISNFVNPVDQYGLTVACATAGIALTVPFVIIKLFTKARVLKQVQPEDYILIAAEISFVGWVVVDLCDSNHNAHIWDTLASRLPRINFYGNLIISLYSPMIIFAKTAVLLQLQRIFVANPFNKIWYTTQSLLWSSTIFYIVIFFSCFFQCMPRVKIWRPEHPGTCLSLPGIMAASAIWNIIVNVGILSIPVVALRGSRISNRKKTIVFSVFSISLLAMAASIGRIVSTISLAGTDDFTYGMEAEAMCALGEVAFMIIAASVPTMPAFLKYCSARWRGAGAEESYKQAAAASPEAKPNPPRRLDPWRQIDEEMATEGTTVLTGTNLLPPPPSPSAPLPPPIVPPKDGGYIGSGAGVEQYQNRTGEQGVQPRAPPPSPVRTPARTWYIDESSSEEIDRKDPFDGTGMAGTKTKVTIERQHLAVQRYRDRHRSV